jgi:hypothetical protein
VEQRSAPEEPQDDDHGEREKAQGVVHRELHHDQGELDFEDRADRLAERALGSQDEMQRPRQDGRPDHQQGG